MRRAATGVAAAVLVLLALLGTQPDARAGSSEPALWSGKAEAFAVQVGFDTSPKLVPLEDLVLVDVPDAATTWDQVSGTARASVLYPGASGTGGPGMICQVGFPCPDGFPPAYPLVANAQGSTQPDDQTPDGSASAHVGDDVAVASAELSDDTPAHDALAAVLQFDTARADSRQSMDGGVLTVESTSIVTGLRLLDGLIRIDQVRTHARSRSDGSAVHASQADVTVQGVRIAGQEVEVGADGIHLAGQRVPGLPGSDALPVTDLLASRGITIRQLGTQHDDQSATTSAQGTGLLITAPIELDGSTVPSLPGTAYRTYITSIVIGGASSSAFADPDGFGSLSGSFPAPAAGEAGPSSAAPSPSNAGAAATPSPPVDAGQPTGTATTSPTTPPAPEQAAPTTQSTATPTDVGDLLGALSPGQIRALYLAGVIAAVGVFLASRAAARTAHLRTRPERSP